MTEVQQQFHAYVCHEAKQKFEPCEYQPEKFEDDDIQIKTTHIGLCHSDVHMRDNDWGNTIYPFVGGHEVVGVVEKVGHNVHNINEGDRVGFGYIRDSCGSCKQCLIGEENVCVRGFDATDLGHWGAFQDHLIVPARFAFKIPEELPSEKAAALMCAGITAYQPLRKFLKRPGSHVGVVGLGGVGHMAVQFADKMGAHVSVIDISGDKEQDAMKLGADCFTTDFQDQHLTHKFDLILFCCSAEVDWNALLNMLQNGGILVLLGAPPTQINIDVMTLISRQLTIAGSLFGGRGAIDEMLNFAAVHNICPMIEQMNLSDINNAMDKLVQNQAKYRIVLTPDEGQHEHQQSEQYRVGQQQQTQQHQQPTQQYQQHTQHQQSIQQQQGFEGTHPLQETQGQQQKQTKLHK